jgi:ribose transport system ATP-binding protein
LKYPDARVSFSVHQGEVFGFAGLIGAGRSEIARAIFGVDSTLGGEISLAGKTLHIKTPQDAIAEGIYLVPEDRRQTGVIVDFTIRENISLAGLKNYANSGLIDTAKEAKLAATMCEKMNVKAPTTEVTVATLSGGNQQKVVLAKWLSLTPKVLIFDEPTRGIDVGAKAEIYALIRNLAAKGITIIVISSEMEEALGISDRIAVMHEGKIKGILDRSHFSEEAVMGLATGGER